MNEKEEEIQDVSDICTKYGCNFFIVTEADKELYKIAVMDEKEKEFNFRIIGPGNKWILTSKFDKVFVVNRYFGAETIYEVLGFTKETMVVIIVDKKWFQTGTKITRKALSAYNFITVI